MGRRKKNQSPQSSSEIFSKVQRLSQLVNACTNETLVQAFQKVPGGSELFELFVGAINDEIETLMSGDRNEETMQAVFSAAQSLTNLKALIDGLYSEVAAMTNSPLLPTLYSLAAKLGAQIPQVKPQVAMPEPPPAVAFQPVYQITTPMAPAPVAPMPMAPSMPYAPQELAPAPQQIQPQPAPARPQARKEKFRQVLDIPPETLNSALDNM